MSEGVTFREADRGVSEIIGFVIVFSLVLGTIAVVYTGGFGGLSDARDVEQVNNAERAFEVLATSYEKMARGKAPHRATEIKLSGSQLVLGELMPASVNNSSDDRVAEMPQHRPIRFEAPGGSRIVLEHGAVIRVDDGAATMQREPDFILDENRTVIRHIELANIQTGSQNLGGDRTVLVRSSVLSSDLLYTGTEVENEDVTFALNTTSVRAVAWVDYFESELPDGSSCSTVGDDPEVTVVCSFETETLYVAKTRIEVRFT